MNAETITAVINSGFMAGKQNYRADLFIEKKRSTICIGNRKPVCKPVFNRYLYWNPAIQGYVTSVMIKTQLKFRILLLPVMVLFSALLSAQTVTELIKKGDKLVTEEKFTEAIFAYNAALRTDSFNSDLYYKLGQAYMFAGSNQPALINYNKALRFNNQNTRVYFSRANVRNVLGDKTGAIADCKKALELDSNYMEVLVLSAYLYLETGDQMNSFINFSKAIQKDPNQGADVFFARGYLFQQIEAWEEAIADYEKAIKLAPKFAEAYNNAAIVLLKLKQDEKAFTYFDTALALNPGYANAYCARGVARMDKGEKEKACADLTRAVELGDPNAAGYKQKNCN